MASINHHRGVMYSTAHKAHTLCALTFGREELEKSTLQTLPRKSAASPDDGMTTTTREAEPTGSTPAGSRLKAYPLVAVLAGVSTLTKSFHIGAVGSLGRQLRSLTWNLIVLNLRVPTSGSGCAKSALGGSFCFAPVFGRRWSL